MRSKTPSFVFELPLKTTQADERALHIRLDAGRQIYNAALGEALRRLDLMRESRDWRAAQAMPRFDGKKPDGTPKINQARKDAFSAVRMKFGFSWIALNVFTKKCRNDCWIHDHIGSQEAQAITKRAFGIVEQYVFGRRGRPSMRGFGIRAKKPFNSVENQCNSQGLRFKNGVLDWNGLKIAVDETYHGDPIYNREALTHRVKYARVLRREMWGRERWFVQLVLEGLAPQRREIGAGTVGLDVGPSTIAAVSDDDAILERFCPSIEHPWRELRRIERAMDRSRRATNPDAFHADGTYRRGARIKVRSQRYQALAQKRRDRERRLAAERKRAHNELANRILGQGRDVRTEKLSYRSFQGAFGRSAKVRAPGFFIVALSRKIEAAGGVLTLINTRKTALSQFDHTTGEYVKKPLSQRTHYFGDGITAPVQRDLYSAFLARNCEPEKLDVGQAIAAWPGAVQRLARAASDFDQSTSGRGFTKPQLCRPAELGVDRAQMPDNRACEAANGVALRGARVAESMAGAGAHACREHKYGQHSSGDPPRAAQLVVP